MKQIRPLQLILHRATRFIFNIKRRSHVTPYLRKLHILPVKFRIRFKVSLLCFKILNKLSPLYLQEQFTVFRSHTERDLRPETGRDEYMFETNLHDYKNNNILSKMKINWNKLPLSLRREKSIHPFKKNLKTFLFKEAYKDNL